VDHAHQLSPVDYSSISGMRNCKAKEARRLRCATARGSGADSHGIHLGAKPVGISQRGWEQKWQNFTNGRISSQFLVICLGIPCLGTDPRGCRNNSTIKGEGHGHT
jgi:hypothetical protein